jgi:hypothetical protein
MERVGTAGQDGGGLRRKIAVDGQLVRVKFNLST